MADLFGKRGYFGHVTNDSWREKGFEGTKEGIDLIGPQKQAFHLVIIGQELR